MSFSVASYNVLADSYVKPDRYPGVSPALLDPGQRTAALVRHVAALDADVVCLQEVEARAFAALADVLAPAGYAGYRLQKGSGKPDGCATFVRGAAFNVLGLREVRYADGKGTGPDSGHVALLHLLESAGRPVGIANTHLKWDRRDTPTAQRFGLRQIRQLLDEIQALKPRCPTWVTCGDFNVTADSEEVRAMTEAGFVDAYRGKEGQRTSVTNDRAKRIDFLFHTADLRASPRDLPPLHDRTPLPSADQPSDHLAVLAAFRFPAAGGD
jgi:endonuclease/exonuclease/phosphatase family metal-dependent hydrolase